MADEPKKKSERISIFPLPDMPDSIDDVAVVPTPSDGEAVKEALDVAQSFGALRGHRPYGGAFNASNFDDSISLSEYIEDAEKRTLPLFEPSNPEHGPLEDLDVLSIAAEFGRPDDSNETSEDVLPENEPESNAFLMPEEETGENTRDMTLKSRLPPDPSTFENEGVPPPSEPNDEKRRGEEQIDATGKTEPLNALHIVSEIAIPESIADYGDIAERHPLDLLVDIYLEKRSGMLILKAKAGGLSSRLFVQDGDVVMAETNEPSLGFDRWLNLEGYLDSEVYEALMRDTSSLSILQRGSALVSRGVIGPRDLNRLLRKYYEHIVSLTFAWQQGTWRFEGSSRFTPGDTSVLIESPTPGLVMQGIVQQAPLAIVESLVPAGAVLKRRDHGICKLAELGLDENAKALLNACDGTDAVWELVEQNPREAERYHRLLAGLVKFQFVDVLEGTAALVSDLVGNEGEGIDSPSLALLNPPAEKSAECQMGSGNNGASVVSHGLDGEADLAAAQSRAVPQRGAEELRAQLMMKLETVRDGSYFDILDVAKDATVDQLDMKKRDILDLFDVTRFRNSGLLGLDNEIIMIRAIVNEAYDVLTHPSIAERYRRAQSGNEDDSIRYS